MATRAERQQKFIRFYKDQTGTKEVDMHLVAEMAVQMGWPLPKPADPLERLAKEFSRSAGDETRIDRGTKQPYKANLAFPRRLKDGKQLMLWVDVDEAPRNRMVQGLNLYRQQMVGEVVMGHNTAEHWSRSHPGEEPLRFEPDLTLDLEIALGAQRRA